MITGKTKVYGLIGNPVAQSFSPFIHNMLADELNIDMTYVTFPVATGNLHNAYQGMKALGVQGMNVTVPYKADIMNEIDFIDEEAKNIGAVNTLVYEGASIRGYNTDWIGLLRSLKRNGVTLENKKVLIIGAGGSARATAIMCAKEKALTMTIANRTVSKATTIAEVVQSKYDIKVAVLSVREAEVLHEFDIIFQTTPLGMVPKTDACPIEVAACLEKAEVAVDLIYNPGETKFLKSARINGCKTINGLEMLFYQAVKAFELWNDLEVPLEVQDRCLEIFEEAVRNK